MQDIIWHDWQVSDGTSKQNLNVKLVKSDTNCHNFQQELLGLQLGTEPDTLASIMLSNHSLS